MTDAEFQLMRQQFPFPWQERVYQHPRQGGIVQMIASNGQEVPLFVITRFLMRITARLAQTTTTPPTGASS